MIKVPALPRPKAKPEAPPIGPQYLAIASAMVAGEAQPAEPSLDDLINEILKGGPEPKMEDTGPSESGERFQRLLEGTFKEGGGDPDTFFATPRVIQRKT